MRAVQRARLWAITWTASQAALAAKRPEGRWLRPTPCLRSRMAFSISAWRRWAGLQLQGIPGPVGDEAVIAVAGEEGQLGTGRGLHPPHDEPHRGGAGLTLEGDVEPDAPCILVWRVTGGSGAADRMLLGHGRPFYSEGRRTRTEVEPAQLHGSTKPASCKDGPLSQEVFMEQESIFIGIDVAKAQLDVAVRPADDRWEISHDDAGIGQLVSQLKSLEPAMVRVEASGGLELPLVAALASGELPVVVVNPRQVRDFARATGKLAKTDALDAAVLAHFAEAVRPPVRPLRDAETQALNSLVARRHQVMTMLVSEKNRLGSAATVAVRPRIEAHIAWLERELRRLGRGSAADSPPESCMAGEGRPPAHRPRRGRATLPHHSGVLAGAGHPGPPADRRPGGRGSLQQGQRYAAG